MMNFKTATMVTFAAANVLTTSLAANSGTTLDRVLEKKELVVATAANWAPQSFMKDNGLVGFDIDVATEVAKRLGATVRFVTPEWGIITAGHWNGRWDISVGSMTPTTGRARILDFPTVYYYTPYVFTVHKDSKAESRADLNGKVIGVEGGTTTEDYINGSLKIDAVGVPEFKYDVKPGSIKTYGDSVGPLDDLRLGDGVRVDATVSAMPTVENAVKRGYPIRALAGEPAFYEPLAVAVDKGDPEFTAKVKEVFDAIKADGTMSELSVKWYGIDYTTLK